MSKTNFLVLQEIIIYKIENLIKKKQQKKTTKNKKKPLLKKTNPIKVLFAQSARARCGFPQFYCSFEVPQTFQFFHFICYKFPNFRAKIFNTLCTAQNPPILDFKNDLKKSDTWNSN